ncbi:hypothetical protein F383_10363 [Gossypium arboreum]|uniref:Uncharacterized protein n=1 Tax=Gossypium arboreum TaxID=29729 RepID=A0A0B0NHN6_GOSAR|nr:hypothetical protein F383_10363 [Gossypium arboreum]
MVGPWRYESHVRPCLEHGISIVM